MAEAENTTHNEALPKTPPADIPRQLGAADAPDDHPPVGPTASPPATHGPAHARGRRWKFWVVGTAALLVGLLAGAGIGVAASRSDPTQSQQYKKLQAAVTSAHDQQEATKESFGAAQRSADASLVLANQALDQREAVASSSEASAASAAAVAASSVAALSQAQAAINANTITEGTWTVGSDVQPGRYRTTTAVAGDCYWEIDRGPGGGIVDNDIVTGGFPTVTLSAGQTFKTQDCGNWLKQ